jgi:hypothetical protein
MWNKDGYRGNDESEDKRTIRDDGITIIYESDSKMKR